VALTASQNPFFNRGTIEEERYFFDRQKETREVFNLLGKPTPQSVSVVGQRKIGKSSFLQHLCRPQVMARWLPRPEELVMVHLNFEGMAYYSEMECLQKLLWETHAALALQGISVGEEFKIDLVMATPLRIVEALNKLFRLLRQEHKKKLVFLFDEFEASTYNPHLTLGFFNTLRSFASNFGVAYVVSTRKELFGLPVYRMGRSSPFFNYFTTVYLKLFEPAEARRLIAELSQGTGVSLAEDEEFLLGWAGAFPFFLQSLCWYLWERRAEGGLGEADLEEVLQKFATQATGHLEYFWSALEPEEQEVAARLARSQPVLDSQAALLDALERKALVARDHGRPRLFGQAFAEFVRQRT
jgi:hypothetical protein